LILSSAVCANTLATAPFSKLKIIIHKHFFIKPIPNKNSEKTEVKPRKNWAFSSYLGHAMKLGIIREGKNPPDNRVALSPHQCKVVKRQFPQWELVVQPSPNRCYTNEEYIAAGISMQEDLSDCDILIGIKEVPIDELIAGKTYFFFSHTKKKQPYNKKLLQAIIQKKIRLIISKKKVIQL
jgi:hypothetical protein